MGFGTWCYLAKGFGCHAHGTELSQTRIDYAKGIDVIAWKDIPGYRFDFINTEQVFEHLSEPLEVLGYLRQSLKPNGLIKINVPDGWDLKKRLAAWDWETLKQYQLSETPEGEVERIKTIWDWQPPDGDGSENSLLAVAPLQHINAFHYESLVRMAESVGLKPVALPAVLTNVTAPISLGRRIVAKLKREARRYAREITGKRQTGRKTTKLFFRKT
jgi:SAM-dependent methyltransferase